MKLGTASSQRFITSKIAKSNPFSGNRILHDPTRELHAQLIRNNQHKNPNAMAQVIKSYALSQSSLLKARFAFIEIEHPTVPIWNHMIRGLSLSGSPVHAVELFDKMRERGLRGDNLTFIYLCKACTRMSDFLYGKRVHVHILKLGFGSYLYVCNALIHMYGFCGELCFSRRVFDEMAEKDLVSWNSLICAYSQSAEYAEVLSLFDAMMMEKVKADAVTMVKVVLACNYLSNWELFDSMLEYIESNHIEIDVYLGNTLIVVSGRRGMIDTARQFFYRMTGRNVVSWNAMIIAADLVTARKLFDEMPKRDVISWTSMITRYVQANQHDDAIKLFQEMMIANVTPDQIIVSAVLSACAHLGRLELGKAVHDYVKNKNIESDIYIENALIDMYCKCGSVEEALKVFDDMKEKDSVSWTSIISGLAVNGDSDGALQLFSRMLRAGSTRPIHGTFIGVLLACVHSGLVEKGLELFDIMQDRFGLVPEMRHYGCVVDLLCRSGDLTQAYEFIKSMPIIPEGVVWRIFLSACQVHGNLVLAKIASDKLIEADPTNGGNYALSCNSYASAERWDDAMKVRELIGKGDVVKPLGWSCIATDPEALGLPKSTC